MAQLTVVLTGCVGSLDQGIFVSFTNQTTVTVVARLRQGESSRFFTVPPGRWHVASIPAIGAASLDVLDLTCHQLVGGVQLAASGVSEVTLASDFTASAASPDDTQGLPGVTEERHNRCH